MCFIYLTKDSLTRTFFIVKYLRHYFSSTCAPRDKETILKVAHCTIFCILANILTIFDSRLSLVTGQVIDPR